MVGLPDIISSLPELTLVVTALALLLLETTAGLNRAILAPVALGGVGLALILGMTTGGDGAFYAGMMVVDSYSRFLGSAFLVIVGLSVLVAIPYLRRTLEERGEYYSLMLFAGVGMIMMVKANDLTMLFLGLELLSISLYVLAGFYRTRVESNEAALKYLLLGAFSAGFFLFGIALLYGSTGTTSYSGIATAMAGGGELSRLLTLSGFGLLLVGFAFKVALVPFHMYAPDVYDGAPTSITAFMSTGPKLAGFGALLKLTAVIFGVALASWWGIIWALAALSMTVGNLSALRQENIKRMLAFSSVAHAGYLAMAILVTNFDSGMGMIFYLVVYGVTTLTAFGIASLLEDDSGRPASMDSFRGLARRNPYLAAMFALVMLSLAGIPPTAGFVGKFFIFNAVLEDGYIWLVVIAVMNSLVSVYYYLRPVVAMYMEQPDVEDLIETPWPMIPVLLLFAIIALGLGLFPATLVQSSTAAVSAIL